VRIQNNNNNSSPTFGYSKPLNKLLKKTLAENLTTENKIILQLNKMCNQAEDTLDIQTKFLRHDEFGSFGKETDDFIGLVADLKMKLAETIEDRFPKLNYAKTEIKGYLKEVGDNDIHWKTELIGAVQDGVPNKDYIRVVETTE